MVGGSLEGGGLLAAGPMSIFEAVVPVVIGLVMHCLVDSNQLRPSEGEAEQSRHLGEYLPRSKLLLLSASRLRKFEPAR